MLLTRMIVNLFDNAFKYSIIELLARVRANLRRNTLSQEVHEVLICGDLELNLLSRDITLSGTILKLTPIEYELLKYFLLHANKTLTCHW